ncbi:MAG TPA: glycosyltransferase [Gemmataceae bacterium]|nr:glycosyltransferase [Gemmataceae bacterium]
MSQTSGPSARRVSVVINTYNRAASLRHTLHALRYQTYEPFEVIVVNGPSTDDTDKLLAAIADVRVAHCAEVNLCKSRNAGIAAADSEIVAFIDDDALPEATWLEELVAAYDADDVGGAGGRVFDHTGFDYQYRYSVCDRLGNTRFDLKPPFDAYTVPGADPFVFLQGTNASFLRQCLVDIGGFDEEIEYYMDEVDVCRRVIDLGYRLRPLPGAAVHHKYLASHRRNSAKVVFDPFPNVKNHCYLAVLNNQKRRPFPELRQILRTFADGVRESAYVHHAAGKFTDAQRDLFLEQVERGLEVGIDKGIRNKRLHREFPSVGGRFVPYGVLCPQSRRLKVCFISQEYPPGDYGGIGRFTCDLATGMAALGHEVHVVTRSADVNRVDFEDGVWMHRLLPQERYVPELDGVPLAGNLFHSSGIYHEVCRIQASAPIDVVSAPLWACEGMTCSLDSRFPTILSLMTSMKTLAGMHPSWGGGDGPRQMIALEGITARRASALHAISHAILEKVQEDTGAREVPAAVVPLGIRDRSREYPSRRNGDGKVQVLFVGRLERRKGVDVLLEAAVELRARHPQVEFILAGKETTNTETGTTYRKAFEERHGGDPTLAGRVTFAGAVSEEQLYQLYADADVVCMPSRYESFGLVLVEAMMFGKPVVGCAIGGMCEIVEPGANGFLAIPGDSTSLVDCLERLIESEALRCEFGKRSRALYEQKYALPIVVENTLRYYGEVSVRHKARPGTAIPATPERLAEVIAEAGGVSAERAAKAAARLLDRSHFPVDYIIGLGKLWHLSAEEFLKRVYPLILKRDPDDEGWRHYLTSMRTGMARGEVVRELVLSEEARNADVPNTWLSESAGVAGCLGLRGWLRKCVRGVRRVVGKVVRRADDRRVARTPVEVPPGASGDVAMNLESIGSAPSGSRLGRLKALLSPRKALSYAKRLLLLPWNFQKVYEAFQQEIPDTIKQIEADIGQHEQRLIEHMEQVTKEMRQLKYRFAEFYGALLEELRRQGSKLDELAGTHAKAEGPREQNRAA